MAIIITLLIINLYCIICVYEALIGDVDLEPKWNVFHRIAHSFEVKNQHPLFLKGKSKNERKKAKNWNDKWK